MVLNIYKDELREKLFDTINYFCERVKYLSLENINMTNVPQLSKIILKFSNYLKYLTLRCKKKVWNGICDQDGFKLGSMILEELSKSLPVSLYYLDLSLIIDPDDLKITLESCKRVNLKKLLIRNWGQDNVENILENIRDFVKEKNLEFLAIHVDNNRLFLSSKECKNLKKLVEEIQSCIKMMRYDDLIIKVSEIDGGLITKLN